MTSKTIDGVSREWLENYAGLLTEHFALSEAKKVRALLAAPEAPRQAEPVFWCVEISGAEKPFSSKKAAENARCRYEKMFDAERMEPFPLYRHPAPLSPDHSGGAGVVVPEFNEWYVEANLKMTRNQIQMGSMIWNACLDKVKDLNQ